MEDKTVVYVAPEVLSELSQPQQAQVANLTRLCGQMAQLVGLLDARLAKLEGTLKARVTITYAQSAALLRASQGQTAALCAKYGLPAERAGKALRAALWRDFRREYSVQNRADLPATLYEQATEFVSGWTSYAAIRRIRERLGP